MQTVRLTEKNNPWYSPFRDIYDRSFPVHEQRTPLQQVQAFADPRYHLDGWIENDRLIGLMSWWKFDSYLYIEHFAIHPEVRGKKYGSLLLQHMKEAHAERLILEIDPVTDEQSARRLRFYQHAGFSDNPYLHIHPPYREGFSGHRLTVLSSRGQLTEQEYAQFYQDLINIVMK